METISVRCPVCGEWFPVPAPSREELPAELDYDCEVCCRPMVIFIDVEGAVARGLGE